MSHGPAKREDGLPVPPDGGWGWVIVLASFLIHIITDGMTYSFGVMYVELLDEFKEGKAYTSWVLSLMCGMTLCSGPISSSFVNKYGCRAVTISGAIIASICLMISYYAQNVLSLIISIGLGVGCGLGLIYLPAIVSVSTYFEKYRSIAIGIAVAGTGVGTFIFAPLVTHLVREFGWRKTLLFLSGIVLNCALFGSLFRPLTPTVEPDSTQPSNEAQKEQTLEVDTVQSDNTRRRKKRSIVQVPSVTATAEVDNGQMTRSQSVGHSMTAKKYNAKPTQHSTRCMLSQPLLTNLPFDTLHENRPLGEIHRRASGTLSRPDIFYQGSLVNISNYRSQTELQIDVEKNGSHQLDNENEVVSDEKCCGCIPVDTHETFLEMMNFGLFTNPIFVLFVLSNFSTCLGFYVPYICLTDRAKMFNISSEESSYFLAIIGIANTIGRVVLGYVSDKPWVNRLYLYNFCLFVCGIATASSVLCTDFTSLAVYSAVFGFTIGAYVGMTSVILVDLLGLDKLTNAFGLLLLLQGLAGFIGPPIVGFLYDKSNSYTPGFLFAGSGFMLFFIPVLQKYYARKQIQRNNALKS